MTLSPPVDVAVHITVRRGSGSGRTPLSAFDSALMEAGVANLNLVTLSSVIPPGSRITHTNEVLEAAHGDRLYCVLSSGHADHPGEIVWSGLGWVVDEETGKGLFVEHHAGSEESLREQITLSLEDMTTSRGGGYGEIQIATAYAHCTDKPVCALVVAAYTSVGWEAP